MPPQNTLKVEPLITDLGKDKVTVDPNVPHRRKPENGFAVLKARALVSLAQRYGEQLTVGSKAPGVVGTAKKLAGVSTRFTRDLYALVRAAVEQNPDGVVRVPDHNHRLVADFGRIVVTHIRDLTGMPDIGPCVREQMAHFELEELLVDIQVAMNSCFLHQIADSIGIFSVLVHVGSSNQFIDRSRGATTSHGRRGRLCCFTPAPQQRCRSVPLQALPQASTLDRF
jgi:hypothetical protein